MAAEPSDPSWMDKVQAEANPSPWQVVEKFLESRWQVALVAAALTAAIVYLTSPPMIHDQDGKPEISKALFWGFVSACLVYLLPLGTNFFLREGVTSAAAAGADTLAAAAPAFA